MMIGQLIGGALGDVIGRWNAMYLVMGIQMLGTFGSALFVWDGEGKNIFHQLAAWRFVLGIGCGGVYPLAAALSAEQASADTSEVRITENQNFIEREKLQKLALTFSTQGLGFAMVPIVAYPLLFLLGPNRLDYTWRIILGLGAIPGFVLAYLRYRWGHSQNDKGLKVGEASPLMTSSHTATTYGDNSENTQTCEELRIDWARDFVGEGDLASIQHHVDEESSYHIDNKETHGIGHHEQPVSEPSLWQSIRCEPDLIKKLSGTAFTWFLFDIVFYGNTLFQPIVLEAAFGRSVNDEHNHNQDNFQILLKTCRDSLFLTLIALPGYFTTIGVIGRQTWGSMRQTPKYIQTQGFIVMAVLYSIIGSNWNTLRDYQWLLVSLYGGTFFFANYGPNTTTFLLPSLTFSAHCRTTLNGISAACGKAGAVVGASMFEPLTRTLGDDSVMLICAEISLFAAFLTLMTVPSRNSV
jgi:PHS family inorganic phosphate transporter-like MFS transporter